MKMQTYSIATVLLLLAVFIFFGVRANQTYNGFKPLSVGDKLPESLVIKNGYNLQGGDLKMNDYKGKLLLIDFWSTWCSSCIEGFSKLHELQNRYNDHIQIFLINTQQSDTEEKVNRLFQRRKERTGTNVTLPYVLQDSLLVKYFPHQSIPHYVWINQEGIVLAITSAKEVTEANIQKVLDGEEVSFRIKKDQLAFTSEVPLFVEGNGGEMVEPLYRSMITGYIEGIGGNTGVRRNDNNAIIGYFSFNKPLLALLQDAYRDLMIYPGNRVIIEADNVHVQQLKSDSAPQYCYELVMPPGTIEQALARMRTDLSATFKVQPCTDKRRIKTWVLNSTPALINSYTKGGEKQAAFEKDRKHKFLRNYSVDNMLWLVNNVFALPVVNAAGMTENIDMDLPDDMYDEGQWLLALRKAGFELSLTETVMDVTIIQEIL